MPQDDKKKQALALMFSDGPRKPSKAPVGAPSAVPSTKDPSPDATPRPAKPARRKASAAASASRDAGVGSVPAPGSERAATRGMRDPYYEGSGVYRRRSGVQVKKSVYLDPEVWRAVSVAGATGDDPRGSNASEIINTLLREAGYGA